MSHSPSPVQVILRKRSGEAHPPGEIEAFIEGFVDGSVTDYQMTAWMMAVLFQGMSRQETARLTRAMIASGHSLPAWAEGPPVIDKHSTGGIGDKVSLIVAPLAAASGLRVPMISGRSLGHTGGTLDKLEAIPGYRVDQAPAGFRAIVERVGVSISGASNDLVPADRRMYALRDVSGIIESPPLIVSSILSKKAAARLDGLVLDVKVGSGGFMPTQGKAEELARMLCTAGSDLGMKTEVILSGMDEPLGRTVGNALEVAEAIDVLKKQNPDPRLTELCLEIAAAMLRVGGESDAKSRRRVEEGWSSGRGLERFAAMIQEHGGDPRVTEDPSRLPRAASTRKVEAREDGWIQSVDARAVGDLVVDLGGGRRRAEDRIDPRVGIEFFCATGAQVKAGQPLAEIHLPETGSAEEFEERLQESIRIDSEPPSRGAIILGRVRST
jgi:pyrimidine-nucleoside phosphorylase